MDAEIRHDFVTYVQARSPVLFRMAMAITGHREQAEDLLQIALMQALRHWSRIRGDDADAYVRRIMYRQYISWWRRPMHRRELSTDRLPESPAGGDEPARVDNGLALHAALRRLAPKYRAVLVLRYFEDLPDAQIAEILGCRLSTVRSQAARALAKLRTLCPDIDTLTLEEIR
ncbi:SigE family RNA polymerase sigma factor [Virgisporangium aurantiacum]|nr:SigE family RNA polymerase sigma factor [Virgisporangium aurantiacum]